MSRTSAPTLWVSVPRACRGLVRRASRTVAMPVTWRWTRVGAVVVAWPSASAVVVLSAPGRVWTVRWTPSW
ncbi:hypothetical protein O1M54_12055 [Streptomyces diastatochromogenes]|nr:hypothetical protein [Streptomyces diastatochromogenes]